MSTHEPTVRPRLRDRLERRAPWLLAAGLVVASMLVARSFAVPGSDAPGPGSSSAPGGPAATQVPWAGPDLYGIFTGCNPACDLEVAVEGIGRRLTMTDRAVDESEPSLSPDRSRVVYRCAEPAIEPGGDASPRPEGRGSLCLVDTIPPEDQAATFPPVTVLLTDPAVDFGGPAWSPDGSLIAFDFSNGPDDVGIGVVPAGGGEPTIVTPETGPVWSPAWSADGSMLAFVCGAGITTDGPSTRFCVMPSEGGDVTALGEVGGECGVPAFMPDGVHLGVVCVVPGAEGGDLFMLAVSEPFTHSYTTSQLIAPEGARRVVFDPEQHYAFVRRGDALWAIGIPGGEWSLPPLPPLQGDFDLRVLE